MQSVLLTLPTGHHPAVGEIAALLARRRARQANLDPRHHRAWPLDAALPGIASRSAQGAADPYYSWPARREVEEGGALLVRPDGYIAWRHHAALLDDDAFAALRGALSDVLQTNHTTNGADPALNPSIGG